jgi:hypothetical protein
MKKVILLKSTSNDYLKRFKDYVESHYTYDEMQEKSIWCVGNKIGQFLQNKSDVLIVYNPSWVISQMLVDIDLITTAIDFEIYRIYLGDDGLPDGYDEWIGENEFLLPLEEQLERVLEMEN